MELPFHIQKVVPKRKREREREREREVVTKEGYKSNVEGSREAGKHGSGEAREAHMRQC
jgi:hypothetical protein